MKETSNNSSPRPKFTYRFRAECENDIRRLLKLIPPPTRLEMIRRSLVAGEEFVPPDCTAEIDTELPLLVLAAYMHCVQDGHVMTESLALKELYTGERHHCEGFTMLEETRSLRQEFSYAEDDLSDGKWTVFSNRPSGSAGGSESQPTEENPT